MTEPTQDHSPKAHLSPEIMATLRAALKQWVDGDGTGDRALRVALLSVASEARGRSVLAEELLVTLKTLWFEVGGAPNAPTPSAPSKTNHTRLYELVTACIKAYYG